MKSPLTPIEKVLYEETSSPVTSSLAPSSSSPKKIMRVRQSGHRFAKVLHRRAGRGLLFLLLAWPVSSYLVKPFYRLVTETYGAYQFLRQEDQNRARARWLLETNAYPEITSLRRRGPMSRELRDAILPMPYGEQVYLFKEWFALRHYFAALGVENKNHDWREYQYNENGRDDSPFSDLILLLQYCPEAFPPQAELDLLPLAKPLQLEAGPLISHENDLKQLIPQSCGTDFLAWQKKVNESLARFK